MKIEGEMVKPLTVGMSVGRMERKIQVLNELQERQNTRINF